MQPFLFGLAFLFGVPVHTILAFVGATVQQRTIFIKVSHTFFIAALLAYFAHWQFRAFVFTYFVPSCQMNKGTMSRGDWLAYTIFAFVVPTRATAFV